MSRNVDDLTTVELLTIVVERLRPMQDASTVSDTNFAYLHCSEALIRLDRSSVDNSPLTAA